MGIKRLEQQNATLHRFKIDAKYQGCTVLVVKGSAYDRGDGATTHECIYESIDDRINGVTQMGGTGRISGLRFDPVPPPKGKGRPTKNKRNVALAMAHEWLTTFFATERNLHISAAKARAYGALVEMWGEQFWQGAADESAVRKNVKKGGDALGGLCLLKYIAPDPSDSLVIAGQKNDFDIWPYERMSCSGICWVWRFGQQHAQYGKVSLPQTTLLEK